MAIVEERSVSVPCEVNVRIDGKVVTVEGPLGELCKDFSHAVGVDIERAGDEIVVRAIWPRKKQKAVVGAIAAHLKNMITGVTKGFTYKLKVVYAHFPVRVKVSGDRVVIENFCGERAPRLARIEEGVAVKVDRDDVIVQGTDVEKVGQTAANIQLATKVKKKDPRVFLDGIYVYEKRVGMEL